MIEYFYKMFVTRFLYRGKVGELQTKFKLFIENDTKAAACYPGVRSDNSRLGTGGLIDMRSLESQH